MRHFYCLLLLLFLLPVSLIAQQKITGKVTDDKNLPLSGATVSVKGRSISTVTDANGNFSLSVPGLNPSLIVSSVGFMPEEISVKGKTTIEIRMSIKEATLDDVVVVGYGTVRKRDLTGAVTSVTINDNEAAQITSIDKLLQGRAAGVTVNSGSSAPGGAVNVRIRGTSTFTGGSEPLYVVDGIIMNTATQDVDNSLKAGTNPGNSYQEAQNGLTAINPQDIESIEILKDASATAIYGSRGANGVVLITTKQGKSGKGLVNFTSTTEFAQVTKKIPVLDAYSFAEFRNKTRAMQGQTPVYDPKTIEPIDWQDDVFRTGITTNNRASFSGKNDKGNYFLALGFLNNNGVIPTTGLKQVDLRFNVMQNISPKLKFSSRTGLIYRTNSMTQSTEQMGSASNSIIRQMLAKEPIMDTLGPTLANLNEDIEGPRAWLRDYDDISREFRAIQSLSMDYKLTKAFTFHVLGGADIRAKERHRWFGKVLGQGKAANGQLGYSDLKNFTYNLEAMLLYNKTAGKSRINATAGMTYDNSKVKNAWTVNEDFFTEELRIHGLGNGARVLPFVEDHAQTSILSALARVVYSYKDRYILTGTGRADGTSRFADGNKWGFFPSIAVAWRASDEEFIKNMHVFSTLKPRLGFGVTGNQAISPYQTITRYRAAYYSANNGTIQVGANPALIANKDLTWESTKQVNIGLDAGFFRDRLNFTVDLYHKKTKDLLQQISLPTSTGFTSMWLNRGSVENKGLELSVNSIISQGTIGWTTAANITFNKNKIADIGLPEGKFGNMILSAFLGTNVSGGNEFKMPANVYAEGYPVAMFFGYQTQGIYQAADVVDHPLRLAGTPLKAGDIYFVDQNGDGNINDADKVILGDPNPKFSYGFSNTVTYKKLSLNIFINGVYGNKIANGNRLKLEDTQAGTNVIDYAYTQAWSPEQPNNAYPRLLYKNGDFTDRIIEDGSYLRLGMVTLGYKPNVKNLKFISGLDLFVSGRNLLTLTNYTGYDPEVNSFTNDPLRKGVDWSSYPNTRSVTVGVNVNF
jgi:TonB-linked SusC/RagA family outer membrane protein